MRACIPLDTWFFISTALQQQLQENYLHAQLCCRLISYPISESCHIHFMMVIKRSCRSLLLFGCRDAETWYCLYDLCPITLNQSWAPAAHGHCPMASSAPWDRSGKQGLGSWHKQHLGLQLLPFGKDPHSAPAAKRPLSHTGSLSLRPPCPAARPRAPGGSSELLVAPRPEDTGGWRTKARSPSDLMCLSQPCTNELAVFRLSLQVWVAPGTSLLMPRVCVGTRPHQGLGAPCWTPLAPKPVPKAWECPRYTRAPPKLRSTHMKSPSEFGQHLQAL